MSVKTLIAQEVKLNDPNLIFKSDSGEMLTPDSVKSIIALGSFSMSKKKLENGQTEVTISVVSKEANNEANTEQDLGEKWKNKKLPEFSLKGLDGRVITNNDLKGKITVLNFWFIGCEPCIREIPKLNELVKEFEEKNIVFLAPSFDSQDRVEIFTSKKVFNYIILADSKKFNEKLDIKVYPAHVIVDQNGIIQKVFFGATDDVDIKLRQEIERLQD